MKFSFKLATEEDAQVFWRLSPDSTFFTNPKVLVFCHKFVDFWILKKGEEPIAYWPILVNEDNQCISLDFFYYVGPCWSAAFHKKSPSKQFQDSINGYQVMIETLLLKYGSLNFSLSPSVFDVRAFSWWNYNSSELNKFLIKPKYTAQIGNLNKISFLELENNLRHDRRRAIKKFKLEPQFKFENSFSFKDVINLYENTLLKSGTNSTHKSNLVLGKLYDLSNMNMGYSRGIIDSGSKELVCVSIVLESKSVANLVLSVTNMEYRDTGITSFINYENLKIAKSNEIETFDFNGANSPHRGGDKHSYGASPKLYFDLSINK